MDLKRINDELQEIRNAPSMYYSAEGVEDNPLVWKATITGPVDSAYEGALFHLRVHFHIDHPYKSPRIIFVTKIYHPNISSEGKICIDILGDRWYPGLTLSKVLLAISNLLAHPFPADPAVPEIASLFLSDPEQFNQTAKEWTFKYAT